MLAYQVDGGHKQAAGPEAFIQRVAQNPATCVELAELSDLLQARTNLVDAPVPGLEDTPLRLHSAYGAREVLTAVGWLTATRRVPFQAGVLPLSDRKTELLFVTLNKTEGYHDRNSYRDHAINTELFHWRSQNSAGPDTVSGCRYLESPGNKWQFPLFVRPRKRDAYRACRRVQSARTTKLP
jgi:hypothetical protein